MPEYFPSSNIARPAYFDRAPIARIDGYDPGGIAPHASTTRFTYTVPSGKKAWIDHAYLYIMRVTAAAPVGYAQALLNYTPNGFGAVNIARVGLRTNTAGDNMHEVVGSMGILVAGDAISGATTDSSTGGTVEYLLTTKRTEFDA